MDAVIPLASQMLPTVLCVKSSLESFAAVKRKNSIDCVVLPEHFFAELVGGAGGDKTVVRRVIRILEALLAPGGRIYFCEAVRAHNPAVRALQNMLGPVHRFCNDGHACNAESVSSLVKKYQTGGLLKVLDFGFEQSPFAARRSHGCFYLNRVEVGVVVKSKNVPEKHV